MPTSPNRARLGLAAALVLFAYAPAAAQQATRDARCLLVSGVFAGSATDQNARQVANATRSFFLGRLDGRLSPSQLAAAVAGERRNISQANMATTMNSCAQYMNRQAQAVQTAIRGVAGGTR